MTRSRSTALFYISHGYDYRSSADRQLCARDGAQVSAVTFHAEHCSGGVLSSARCTAKRHRLPKVCCEELRVGTGHATLVVAAEQAEVVRLGGLLLLGLYVIEFFYQPSSQPTHCCH